MLVVNNQRLLLALAEELKLPLMQISRSAELADSQNQNLPDAIRRTADMAIRLVDGYILSMSSASDQTSLELEPITVSSVLYDVAHNLSKVARQYGHEIEVNIPGKHVPVMGNRQNLDAAFTLLGYGLLTDIDEGDTKPRLTLAAHRSARGIVAGIFTDNPALSADVFKRAKALGGSARQTMPHASHGNGAGILIADSLLRYLSAPLKIARHHKQLGLAATLIPSQQMRLV